MRRQFYLGTDGIFLVFDLTNSKSFDSISRWYQDIENQLKKTREITGFIIGNKTDLINEKIVGFNQAKKLANNLNLNYIETSALTGDNVEQAFYDIAKSLYESLKDEL